jgi:hypothetical protein
MPPVAGDKAREVAMKFATIALLLLVGLVVYAISRRRAAAREAAAEAAARSRTARRPPVPTVSNNLKGVTASQTIQPLKPREDGDYVDDR